MMFSITSVGEMIFSLIVVGLTYCIPQSLHLAIFMMGFYDVVTKQSRVGFVLW